ncbi:MAG: FAD-binding protein [Desulfobacterales bacterium]|nr:FAD-binding protein [Desulfobacterales bacterium]
MPDPVQENEIEADVLVVGGGSSGLWAAIRAAEFCSKVVVADKGIISSSGVSTMIHGVQSPLDEASILPAMEELVVGSSFLSDQDRLALLLQEMGSRFHELVDWGVPFERDADGRLHTETRMGLKVNRMAFINGRLMMRKMKDKALSKGIVLMERTMVTDLLTSDGGCPTRGRVVGAVGFHVVSGDFILIKAKSVILTTGLISAKRHLAYADGLTGDGTAMALRAGAELENMELAQSAAFSIWERKFSTGGQAEYMRAGAKVVNNRGEDIIYKYASDKKAPFLTKMNICFAAVKEILEGRGPIYMDMRHLTDKDVALLRSVLPSAMRAFDESGVDLQKQLVEITPIVHHFGASSGGGIRISIDGETSIAGLYAAGCAAHNRATYVSGAGQGQAFNFFSGYRAGQKGGRTASEAGNTKIDPDQARALKKQMYLPLTRSTGPSPRSIYLSANKATVPAERSFFKHELRIKPTLADLQRIREEDLPAVRAADIHELVRANEARNTLLLLEAIFRSSLERKESRLTHFREEFPYRDDVNWLKWVVIRKDAAGFHVRHEDIPVDQYPIKSKSREKVPGFITFTWGKT